MKKEVVLNEAKNKQIFNIQKSLDKENNSLKLNSNAYKGEELFMKKQMISDKTKTNEKLIKLLTKICLDFKIQNYEEEIEEFLTKYKKI